MEVGFRTSDLESEAGSEEGRCDCDSEAEAIALKFTFRQQHLFLIFPLQLLPTFPLPHHLPGVAGAFSRPSTSWD
jgi:hypothetical protein